MYCKMYKSIFDAEQEVSNGAEMLDAKEALSQLGRKHFIMGINTKDRIFAAKETIQISKPCVFTLPAMILSCAIWKIIWA